MTATNKGGKPRKSIRVVDLDDGTLRLSDNGKGREITGLSLNKPSGRFYAIDPATGKRVYYGRDVTKAVAEFTGQEPVVLRIKLPPIPLRGDGAQIGAQADAITDAAAALVTGQPEDRKRLAQAAMALPSVPSPQRLSDALTFWREWVTAKGRSARHVAETEASFNAWVKVVGDKAVNQLTKSDFANYELKLARKSPHFQRQAWKRIGSVLRLALRKTELALPSGLTKWLGDVDSPAYVPKAVNKEPLPVPLFQALITRAEQLAALEPEAMPVETVKQRGLKSRAIVTKRNATQAIAILRLACQAALDPVDIARLTWDNLKLDGKTPYLDFPRVKAMSKLGVAVPRKTPLLPETVAALKAWREYEPPRADRVFRTSSQSPLDVRELSKAFKRLKEKCSYKETDSRYLIKRGKKIECLWSFKHLRNVGPTVRRDAGLPADMTDALLGHAITGVNKFYTGEATEAYLLPLIEAIGARYFAA